MDSVLSCSLTAGLAAELKVLISKISNPLPYRPNVGHDDIRQYNKKLNAYQPFDVIGL